MIWRTAGNRRREKRRPGFQIVTYVQDRRVAVSKHYGMPNAFNLARAAWRDRQALTNHSDLTEGKK